MSKQELLSWIFRVGNKIYISDKSKGLIHVSKSSLKYRFPKYSLREIDEVIIKNTFIDMNDLYRKLGPII